MSSGPAAGSAPAPDAAAPAAGGAAAAAAPADVAVSARPDRAARVLAVVSVAAAIAGVLSFVMTLFGTIAGYGFVALLLMVAAIVTGIVALVVLRRVPQDGRARWVRPVAVTGLVLGALELALIVAAVVVFVVRFQFQF